MDAGPHTVSRFRSPRVMKGYASGSVAKNSG